MQQIKFEFPYEKYSFSDDGKKHEITIKRLRKMKYDTIDFYYLVFNDYRNPYMIMLALLEEHNGRFYSIKLDNYADFLASLNFCESKDEDIEIIKKDISILGTFKDFNEYLNYRRASQQQNNIKMVKTQKNLSY